MAATVTELAYRDVAGSSAGAVVLYGTSTNAGGATTTIIIQPGNNTVNISGPSGASTGLRTIHGWSITNKTGSRAFTAVKSFDATAQGDKITITCTADDAFDWTVWGDCAGA